MVRPSRPPSYRWWQRRRAHHRPHEGETSAASANRGGHPQEGQPLSVADSSHGLLTYELLGNRLLANDGAMPRSPHSRKSEVYDDGEEEEGETPSTEHVYEVVRQQSSEEPVVRLEPSDTACTPLKSCSSSQIAAPVTLHSQEACMDLHVDDWETDSASSEEAESHNHSAIVHRSESRSSADSVLLCDVCDDWMVPNGKTQPTAKYITIVDMNEEKDRLTEVKANEVVASPSYTTLSTSSVDDGKWLEGMADLLPGLSLVTCKLMRDTAAASPDIDALPAAEESNDFEWYQVPKQHNVHMVDGEVQCEEVEEEVIQPTPQSYGIRDSLEVVTDENTGIRRPLCCAHPVVSVDGSSVLASEMSAVSFDAPLERNDEASVFLRAFQNALRRSGLDLEGLTMECKAGVGVSSEADITSNGVDYVTASSQFDGSPPAPVPSVECTTAVDGVYTTVHGRTLIRRQSLVNLGGTQTLVTDSLEDAIDRGVSRCCHGETTPTAALIAERAAQPSLVTMGAVTIDTRPIIHSWAAPTRRMIVTHDVEEVKRTTVVNFVQDEKKGEPTKQQRNAHRPDGRPNAEQTESPTPNAAPVNRRRQRNRRRHGRRNANSAQENGATTTTIGGNAAEQTTTVQSKPTTTVQSKPTTPTIVRQCTPAKRQTAPTPIATPTASARYKLKHMCLSDKKVTNLVIDDDKLLTAASSTDCCSLASYKRIPKGFVTAMVAEYERRHPMLNARYREQWIGTPHKAQ